MPLRRTLSDYLASLLAASRRKPPKPEPKIVESELHILSNLVVKKDRLALSRVTDHLERHKQILKLTLYRYSYSLDTPAIVWAFRKEQELLLSQSQIKNTHRQDMQALEFMQF